MGLYYNLLGGFGFSKPDNTNKKNLLSDASNDDLNNQDDFEEDEEDLDFDNLDEEDEEDFEHENETYNVYIQFDDDEEIQIFDDVNYMNSVKFELINTGDDRSFIEFRCKQTNKKFKIFVK